MYPQLWHFAYIYCLYDIFWIRVWIRALALALSPTQNSEWSNHCWFLNLLGKTGWQMGEGGGYLSWVTPSIKFWWREALWEHCESEVSCSRTQHNQPMNLQARAWRQTTSSMRPPALHYINPLTSISPALAVANWVMTHSLMLGPHIPTRSPLFKPMARSPAARLSTWNQHHLVLVPTEHNARVKVWFS